MQTKKGELIMKRFLKVLVVVLCLSMFTPNIAQSPGVESVQAAQKVKLNYTKKTIYEGDSFKLKVSGTSKKVKWTSSNKKVATVSSKGVVKGKSGGNSKKTCKITAAVGSKKYVCKVTVKAVPKEDEEVEEGDDANEDNASNQKPSNDAAQNIAELKNEIQKNGYTNTNGDKAIRGLEGSFTPAIIYVKNTDVLRFIMIGQSDYITTVTMEVSSSDNSLPVKVIFMCAGKGFSFTVEGTIIPSEYSVDQGCYFTFKGNNSPFSESDIQELSNSILKLAFTEWDYTLKMNTSYTMKDIGFTEVSN